MKKILLLAGMLALAGCSTVSTVTVPGSPVTHSASAAPSASTAGTPGTPSASSSPGTTPQNGNPSPPSMSYTGTSGPCGNALNAELNDAWAHGQATSADIANADKACAGETQLDIDVISLQIVCSKPAAERNQLALGLNPGITSKMPGICSDSPAEMAQVINSDPS